MKISFNETLNNAVNGAIEELFDHGGEHPCWYCENYGKCNCAQAITQDGETFFDDDYYDDPNGCENFSPDQKAIERAVPSIERDIEGEMEASWYGI